MTPHIDSVFAGMARPPDGATVGRQSAFNKMQLCPAMYGFQTDPEYLQPLGESLTMGDGVHYLCDRHLAGHNPEETMKSFDDWLEEKLCNEYQWSLKQIPNYGDLRQELFDAYRLWIFQVFMPNLSSMSSAYTETTLYMPLSEQENLWLEGTPDLMIPSVRGWDWKTAKTSKQWSQAKADLALQPSLYLALHNHVFQEELRDFTFAVYNRQKAEWTTFQTARRKADLDAAVATAVEYTRQIAAQAFPATPVVTEYSKRKRGWYCSAKWCGAWNICPHKYMNDDVNEDEVAERVWF